MFLLSWNVNGIRAVHRKGLFFPILKKKPDIICLQETKVDFSNIPEDLKKISNYHTFFEYPKSKKGYSGVALYTREKPVSIKTGFGIKKFDEEGRIQIVEYKKFVLFNIYFPNGKASEERLKYKMDFYDAFFKYVLNIRKRQKNIIIACDLNTAHREIDLARPKENEKVSGFLPEEREWIDKFLSSGFLDTFRIFNKKGGNYTWWDLKSGARARNVGWRIDYFFVSDNLVPSLVDAFIMPDVMGSDHCPIGIILKTD